MSALLKEASKVHGALAEEWAAHLKLCRECRPLTDTRNRYCKPGWELAKQLQAAKNRVSELKAGCGAQPIRRF